MKLSEFKFKLPEELIATHPAPVRDESRLLVLHRKDGSIEHKVFKDILEYFDENDLFVFNDTRLFPAVVSPSLYQEYRVLTLSGSLRPLARLRPCLLMVLS